MLEQVKLEDTVGKTIKAAMLGFSDALVIFTDDTFVSLGSAVSYDDSEIIEEPLSLRDMGESHIELGLVTAQEVAESRAQLAKEREWHIWQREQREYERLKKTFG